MFDIKPTFTFGAKIFHDEPYKLKKKYMFNKKSRIQKKWNKKYIEIKTNYNNNIMIGLVTKSV